MTSFIGGEIVVFMPGRRRIRLRGSISSSFQRTGLFFDESDHGHLKMSRAVLSVEFENQWESLSAET